MTLDVDRLARRIAGSGVANEWIVRERQAVATTRALGDGDVASESIARCFDVAIFRDRRQTRGAAIFTLTPDGEDQLAGQLTDAVGRASANAGPLWRLPAPAAPARVQMADAALIEAPADALASVAVTLARRDQQTRIPATRATLITTRSRVRASTGYDHQYVATELRVAATLMVGTGRLRATSRLDLRVRRLSDLALERELADAAQRLTQRAGADTTPAGRYDLVIASRALSRATIIGDGWLGPVVAQASGELARRGLARFQPGQPVALATAIPGDPVTIISDGTRHFALESAPFDPWGGPVRRFTVVDAGAGATLALDQREAALRGEVANGGARNATLEPGERSLDELASGERPRLVVTDLAWLQARPESGQVAGEIDLATVTGSVSNTATGAVTGGQFSFDLYDVLGRLRLSKARLEAGRGAGGPAWIGIPDIVIT